MLLSGRKGYRVCCCVVDRRRVSPLIAASIARKIHLIGVERESVHNQQMAPDGHGRHTFKCERGGTRFCREGHAGRMIKQMTLDVREEAGVHSCEDAWVSWNGAMGGLYQTVADSQFHIGEGPRPSIKCVTGTERL